ncbi:MAG: tRNA (adenosine(37)-N6)-threonylcarbamoyltransferase complex ATPase subunit type 1 TsaE [Candidatus Daviesbacteria bacterium]|nr:tRNA (adenosine(37)-N6)-threonylcarbamoyltransferase complex ATPase subunit type 1 TsaE [Candidatus Daviesbacteria bacterium]
MKYITKSAEETRGLGKKIAQKYQNGGILALFGDLGAGKTTFTQGFAKGLGIKNKVISPTFIVMRQYPLIKNKAHFYHIDLYRLDQINQLEEIGLSEIFANPQNVILIEWAEKLGTLLPRNAVKIKFNHIKEDSREIEITEPE